MILRTSAHARKSGGGVEHLLATRRRTKVQCNMISSFDRGVFEYEGRKKVVVFGSRTFNNFKLMMDKLDNYLFFLDRPIILSGGQKTWDPGEGEWIGADHFAEKYAFKRFLLVRVFHADWEKHGKKAGPIRNAEMAKDADLGVAFWDGKSRGTANMIERLKKKGKPVKVVYYLKLKKKKKKRKK